VRLEREARDEAERKLAAQRAREIATRKALVRARQIAAVCAVLAVGALGSAVFGYVSMKRAQEAELKAQQTREMAEAARGESEKLVAYLLDDFYMELAPVGRLDIVGELAKRALHYYDALPETLRTPQTERNRALALVRYGSVLRTQARLDESKKALDEAVKVLEQMREQGDTSETTAIGLALGYVTQGRVESIANRDGDAMAKGGRAVEAIKPLATAPNASLGLRRVWRSRYFSATCNGAMARTRSPSRRSKKRAVLRGIDDLRMIDLTPRRPCGSDGLAGPRAGSFGPDKTSALARKG
jgi:type II secretory pathway pseudopilin PulG